MMAGGLIVPYVPKAFYSIPGAVVIPANPQCIITIGDHTIIGTGSWSFSSPELHLAQGEADAFLFGTGEKQPLGFLSMGDLIK